MGHSQAPPHTDAGSRRGFVYPAPAALLCAGGHLAHLVLPATSHCYLLLPRQMEGSFLRSLLEGSDPNPCSTLSKPPHHLSPLASVLFPPTSFFSTLKDLQISRCRRKELCNTHRCYLLDTCQVSGFTYMMSFNPHNSP